MVVTGAARTIAFAAARGRVPLIKFRKEQGGQVAPPQSSSQPKAPSGVPSVQNESKGAKLFKSGNVVENVLNEQVACKLPQTSVHNVYNVEISQPGRAASSSGTIEDWQLPAKYRRSPLSDKEIEIINRGGRE